MAKLKPFTMPKWGIEMAEGTVAEWAVAENEPFDRGATLALVETDKISNEIEAEADGRFVRLIAKAGETYPVGALLAVLSDGGEASAAEIEAVIAEFRPADTSFTGDQDKGSTTPVQIEQGHQHSNIPEDLSISPAARRIAEDAGLDVAGMTGSGRKGRITAQDVHQLSRPHTSPNLRGPYALTPASNAFASPLARRLGHLHDIDLEKLTGTGPKGRICKADVLALVPGKRSGSPASYGEVQIVPMSSMRRTIARRLTEAKQTIPHFYLRRRVRADRLMRLRAAVEGARPTLNDYLVKACALALIEVPEINIQVHGDAIHRFPHADIAVAIATDRGLMTPIVTSAEQRSVADISAVVADLAQRARAGRLKADEIAGGSFSLSNLGSFGIEQFDAIINPPQGAILAVGAARSEPIDDDGAIRLVPMIHLSLSCDHRAIDGADGARFMKVLARLIEAPALLD